MKLPVAICGPETSVLKSPVVEEICFLNVSLFECRNISWHVFFSEMFLGLPGEETLFPTPLHAHEKFWETMFLQQCFLTCRGLLSPFASSYELQLLL